MKTPSWCSSPTKETFVAATKHPRRLTCPKGHSRVGDLSQGVELNVCYVCDKIYPSYEMTSIIPRETTK